MSAKGKLDALYAKLIGTTDLGTFTASTTGSLGEQLAAISAGVTSSARVHVDARNWDNGQATDYWLKALGDANQLAALSATNGIGLPGFGWTCTSLTTVTTATGDLNSSADVTPFAIGTDGTNDLLSSPIVFGGYDNFDRVGSILGYTPTKLVLDGYWGYPTNASDQTEGVVGLLSGTDAAAAGSAGAICRQGGNFALVSDLGSDQGSAADTAYHRFRIEYTHGGNTEWFIAGVSQGTITTETDIWPLPFRMAAPAANTNILPALAWVHLYYV